MIKQQYTSQPESLINNHYLHEEVFGMNLAPGKGSICRSSFANRFSPRWSNSGTIEIGWMDAHLWKTCIGRYHGNFRHPHPKRWLMYIESSQANGNNMLWFYATFRVMDGYEGACILRATRMFFRHRNSLALVLLSTGCWIQFCFFSNWCFSYLAIHPKLAIKPCQNESSHTPKNQRNPPLKWLLEVMRS